ncbi:hypothetical protein KSP39_PZI021056 [Platanthera zijinensis]|uniref:Reverse transcriptase Ty1/copia-type domain-containing protein n=1 Tax=Platanthera zijinensis TaxID=2320716 RepID=A0AAP0AXW7_9ASPA
MAVAVVPAAAAKLLTPELIRAAAKQSDGIRLVPLSLRRAIKKYLRDKDKSHMNRKVLLLSQSFNRLKETNLQLASSASRELVEDPFRPVVHGGARWKIRSAYGDIGLKYKEDETVAYVASRMPAVYTACHRVLKEVHRRLPDFSPASMLDFGAGPGSAIWAMREVWPKTLERVNLVEPSKDMQRVAQCLLSDLKGVPIIHSYDDIQTLNRNLNKHERGHDLVISSYALGEIPSLSDRITIVRQLWDLTRDVLVLLEPGTPHGSKIIQQMRSYILWMAKRKCRKCKKSNNMPSEEKAIVDARASTNDAFVVAPCSHDGQCPLENSGKYCHFVQRLERTSSQRAYKLSNPVLRMLFRQSFLLMVLYRIFDQRIMVLIVYVDDFVITGNDIEEIANLKPLLSAEFEVNDLEILRYFLGMEVARLNQKAPDRAKSSDEVDYRAVTRPVRGPMIAYRSNRLGGTVMPCHEELFGLRRRANGRGGLGRSIFTLFRRGDPVQGEVRRSWMPTGANGRFIKRRSTRSKSETLHCCLKRSFVLDVNVESTEDTSPNKLLGILLSDFGQWLRFDLFGEVIDSQYDKLTLPGGR